MQGVDLHASTGIVSDWFPPKKMFIKGMGHAESVLLFHVIKHVLVRIRTIVNEKSTSHLV